MPAFLILMTEKQSDVNEKQTCTIILYGRVCAETHQFHKPNFLSGKIIPFSPRFICPFFSLLRDFSV